MWFPEIGARLSRRSWLSLLPGILLPAARGFLCRPLMGAVQEAPKPPSAVDTVDVNRAAASTSFEAVEKTVTPVDQFFARSHYDQPLLSMTDWKLRIEGRVETPQEVTFSDLIECPTQTLEAVLECAGNRRFLVSNGLWEGVPLAYLLKQAGLKAGAAQVLLEGPDEGRLMEGRPNHPFARLVPLAKCLASESLVAFKLNGQFLPPRNGFPARAFFPGWYGVDSVKWLRRIVVLGHQEQPESFYSSGMHLLYSRWVRDGGQERITSRVSDILVRSVIAFPANRTNLAAGAYAVWGFAWTGKGLIQAVEISTDAGTSWKPAKLESKPAPFAWVRWSFDWVAAPGAHVLLSRARDDTGTLQPMVRDPSRLDGYECNWCEPVQCSVL